MASKDNLFDSNAKFQFVFGLVSGIAVMSLLLFVVLFIMFWSGNRTFSQNVVTTQVPNQQVGAPSDALPSDYAEPAEFANVRPIDDTDHAKGPANAPIQFIEYSDFECPFCGQFQSTIAQVEQVYGDQVQFSFRHFPLSFHPNAQKAGEAAECAAEQGKFWEMHDRIFNAQDTADFNVAGWKKFAGQLGLNTTAFSECLDSGRMASKLQAGIAEGTSLGVTGTPTAFINGQVVRGALPFAQVQAMIEAELQK